MSDAGERGSELQQLCRACGACCSGAMFDHVVVQPEELAGETRRRLRVVTSPSGVDSFRQPCTALTMSGCGVYDDRPGRCRAYTCGLYQEHERGGGELEPRLAKVRRIRALLDKIRARADEATGEWLPAPIAEMLHWDASKMSELRENVGEETLLDIAELGMRVRRDLGHVPKND